MKVHVLAVNNKPPMFVNGDQETFYVFDSARNGTVVGTVLATDLEDANPEKLIYILNTTNSSTPAGVSDKFELVYSKNSANAFHWGAVELITKAKLNARESPYTLLVTAYDGPIHLGSSRSSQKLLHVNVMNKGSVSIWVDRATGEAVDYYMKTVDEELPAGTHVVTVQAVAPAFNKQDVEGVEIVYAIETNLGQENSNNTDSNNQIQNPYYRINSTTGEVFTTETRLDYEEIDPFKKQLMRDLKIRAFSEDGLHLYVTHVSVAVRDVNDNSPRFDMIAQENLGFQFCVVENRTSLLSSGEYVAVGRVRAVDFDSGVNGEVVYRLDEAAANYEEVREVFEIDEKSGEIFLKSEVDREKNETIVVGVVGADRGLPEARWTAVEVRICVMDVNDNRPEFGGDMPAEVFVEENRVDWDLKLNATDVDAGANGTVFFYIQEDRSNKFVIDPKTSKS